MEKIKFGVEAKLLLFALSMSNVGASGEPLSGEEWEAACSIMGLQIAFGGELPPAVAAECHATMAEVARRSGLPLHVIPAGGSKTAH